MSLYLVFILFQNQKKTQIKLIIKKDIVNNFHMLFMLENKSGIWRDVLDYQNWTSLK